MDNNIQNIFSPVAEDFVATHIEMEQQLHSEVHTLHQVVHYITESGGKRIRPLVVLLCAKACGYKKKQHIKLAAAIEIIHTATLLHDDVIDNALARRGKSTVNQKWGSTISVLSGDFLYAKAFQLLVGMSPVTVLETITKANYKMAEGEILQWQHQGKTQLNETDYFNIIDQKTAKLFFAGAKMSAQISNIDLSLQNHVAFYGKHLGIAYQLIDDALDYQLQVNTGKNTGNDLSEGKMTLPLIYIFKHGPKPLIENIKQAFGNSPCPETLINDIQKTRAIDYTITQAKQHALLAKQAIAELPSSIYQKAALDLADYIVHRTL